MLLNVFKNTVLLFVLVMISCGNVTKSKSESLTLLDKESPKQTETEKNITVGANQTVLYLPILQDKRVGIVANQTSVIFKGETNTHLVDSLLALNVDIKTVFAPEHGFRAQQMPARLLKMV